MVWSTEFRGLTLSRSSMTYWILRLVVGSIFVWMPEEMIAFAVSNRNLLKEFTAEYVKVGVGCC